MPMSSSSTSTRPSRLQQILSAGREHWDHPGYDPDSRQRFLRATQCKTPELGQRLYASDTEERSFCNTCKSPACASCGHRATLQWQRERWCALPEGPYCVITFTMPNTLWPFFAANPKLCRKLAVIAAQVIIAYARVRHGVEAGVMPMVHTFNGKLEFNSHVHALVLARHPQRPDSSIFFDPDRLMRSWKRMLIGLLRAVSKAGCLRSQLSDVDVERLLLREEMRNWWKAYVQGFDGKEHFLRYAGRYVRRPPIAQRRLVEVAKGSVRFWYKDKRSHKREFVTCTTEEFIDRWAQHIPKRYRHSVRYFGLLAPRRWRQISAAVFALAGAKQRPRPKSCRWAVSVERLSGRNPLIDSEGKEMKFIKHLSPTPV